MLRHVLLVLLALSLPAAADDAADRANAMAKAMKDAWYVWKIKDVPAGYARYRVSPVDGKPALTISIEIKLRYRGQLVELGFDGTCKPDAHLTPSKARGLMKAGDEGSLSYTIDGAKAVAKIAGRPDVPKDLPAGTVIWTQLFLVACTRPQKDGAPLKYQQFEIEDWNIKPDRSLTYGGKQQLTVGGKKLDAHLQKTQRMQVFISPERKLLRAVWDGRKSLELTDEKTARAALGK